MAIMYGNGAVTSFSDSAQVVRSMNYTAKADWSTAPSMVYSLDGKTFEVFDSAPENAKSASVAWYDEAGAVVSALEMNHKYIGKFSPSAVGHVIKITADNFPGTYRVVGDTYARSEETGKDQAFQFVIEKAKVSAENSITLEAEGDPSVFNLNLTVLRPSDGEMMKLIQYDLA